MLQGAEVGAMSPQQIGSQFNALSDTINAVFQGLDKPLDWQSMMPQASPDEAAHQLRKFIITKPVLNYTELQPGADASDAVRQAANAL